MQNNSLLANLSRGISKRAGRLFNGENRRAGIGWIQEKFLKHAQAGKLRTFKYRHSKIYYNNPSEFLHTMREIFGAEIYGAELPPNAFIIDCGANIGISTIYFKLSNPTSTVLAFEPDPRNFSVLEKNIQSFNLSNVTARREAVWTEDTTLNFASDGNMGSKIGSEGSTNTGQLVKATRLKALIDRPVDFLKIDIEGAEYQVLKDIREELRWVNTMFFEYHGRFKQNNELTEIFTWIQRAGFSYYIKEAAPIYDKPFLTSKMKEPPTYDVQLNIFCFRT